MVSPAKQIWKCFSSSKGGNVVSFLMEAEHFSYVEALKWLANKYNIEIKEDRKRTPEEIEASSVRENLSIINEFATGHLQPDLTILLDLSHQEKSKKRQGDYIKRREDAEKIMGIESKNDTDPNPIYGAMANHNGEQITAYKDTIVFMPLYQVQGEEGFFLIRKIPRWILSFSAFLRRIKFDSFLALLPGVSWSNGSRDKLMVNLKVAMFFSKPFFHLLGYRNRVLDKTHFTMNNRELTAKNEMYKNTWWYRITTSKSI
jgi:hypothetical protein